jgi:hypothetical protein
MSSFFHRVDGCPNDGADDGGNRSAKVIYKIIPGSGAARDERS